MDRENFVLSVRTKNIKNDLKDLEDLIDFSNLDKNNELSSNKSEKVVSKTKKNTKKIWIDEFIGLRSKAYSNKTNVWNTSIIKSLSASQSKNIQVEDYYNCLFGGENQKECDSFIICSTNHDMYLQKVCKSTKSSFDDEQLYMIETESTP